MSTDVRRRWLRPMRGRSTNESHRATTPLELLFDLCFVVAVAQAALPLHHDISEGHVGHGIQSYLMVFFAIWWAWMNFTWFASAYDTDDDVYRITTLVQIAGALVLAAGVGPAFEDGNFTIITFGYVIMRLAMVVQWLRAARGDAGHRSTAIRYAAGIIVVQVLWLLRLALPEKLLFVAFLVVALLDVLVPIVAERSSGGMTSWHPEHIAERYGLFTIIMLGEAVTAATIAIRTGLDAGEYTSSLLSLTGAGLVIVFALWWIYFDRPAHDLLVTMSPWLWGYGHYFIFASAAAVGAGIGVAADHATHHSHLSATGAAYAIAVPVAVFLLGTWLLMIRPRGQRQLQVAFPAGTVLVLLAPLGPVPVHLIAVILVALVAVLVTIGRRDTSA